MSQELDYEALHSQVTAEVKKRKFRTRLIFFVTAVFTYVIFLIMAGTMINQGHFEVQRAAGGTPPGLLGGLGIITGAVVLLAAAGLVGLLFQSIGLYLDTRRGESALRERLLARAIAKQMRTMDNNQDEQRSKRKRTQLMIDDDGEVSDVDIRWGNKTQPKRMNE